MERLISKFNDKIKIITPCDEYHYFFAYYDMRATGEMGINQRHLVHRVSFMDRLQRGARVCADCAFCDGAPVCPDCLVFSDTERLETL